MFTALWVTWLAAFGVVEAVALARKDQGDTLSEHTRKWFRTDTKRGKFLWLSLWGLFSLWFGVHIGWVGTV